MKKCPLLSVLACEASAKEHTPLPNLLDPVLHRRITAPTFIIIATNSTFCLENQLALMLIVEMDKRHECPFP